MAVNVLIVDDSAVMRKILERSLRQAQISIGNVLEAGDGVEALQVLSANGGVGIIFSDVNMPNMDGLEFLKQLRETDGFKNIPVVMVTTEGTEAKVMQAISLGAGGYIRKPFTSMQMQQVLAKILP